MRTPFLLTNFFQLIMIVKQIQMNLSQLQHIVLIPDGNRRWAKKKDYLLFWS